MGSPEKNFQPKFISSQIFHYLILDGWSTEKKFGFDFCLELNLVLSYFGWVHTLVYGAKKKKFSPNLHQTKSSVISFWKGGWAGAWVPQRNFFGLNLRQAKFGISFLVGGWVVLRKVFRPEFTSS